MNPTAPTVPQYLRKAAENYRDAETLSSVASVRLALSAAKFCADMSRYGKVENHIAQSRVRAVLEALVVADNAFGVEDIRGSRGLDESGTTFEPGTLVLSLEDPNGWYVLEEANVAAPEITSLLHNLLDCTGQITIPEIGTTVKVRPNWRCFMTRNSGYAGTREMNKALESRCALSRQTIFRQR